MMLADMSLELSPADCFLFTLLHLPQRLLSLFQLFIFKSVLISVERVM